MIYLLICILGSERLNLKTSDIDTLMGACETLFTNMSDNQNGMTRTENEKDFR